MRREDRKPISNCYVFAKVMKDHKNLCKRVVELALGEEVLDLERIEAESEEGTVISRSVRFDTYLKADGARIVIEMQARPEPLLAKRNRYYHAWLDRRALPKGKDLQDLADACVIFICKFDPIGWQDPIYNIARCAWRQEGEARPIDDGSRTIILNAKSNLAHASPELAELLEYIDTGKCREKGGLTRALDDAIDEAYKDEEWVRGMGIIEVDKATRERDIADKALAKGRREGRRKGRAEGEARGAASERARQAALLDALDADGRDIEDLAEGIMHGTLDDLYLQYGIE